MAEAVGIQPSQTRVAGKQKHRQNTKADIPKQYYLRNRGIPFMIMELDEQFSEMSLKASSLLGLIPAIICNKDISINGAVDIYKDDLPSPELIDMELARWKSKFEGKQAS
ncbi:hypothetical protein EMCRGX_G035023 [Ephydatia muelleri]